MKLRIAPSLLPAASYVGNARPRYLTGFMLKQMEALLLSGLMILFE